MQTGTIATLTDRGYGFIMPDGGDKDLFFHANEVVGTPYNDLNKGDKVTFEVTEGPKGLNATNVQVVTGDDSSSNDDSDDTEMSEEDSE